MLRMSPLNSPRRWESGLIPLGVWRPPRPFSQVSQFRTSAMLRDGLRPWLLSGSMAWTCEPPRLFHPLALVVLRLDTHGAGIGKSGAVGISFPSVFSTQLEFLKRNVLGYVCNPSSSKERDAASRGHTSGIPASACFILEADAGFTARAFIPAGHYVTSPVTFRPPVGQIAFGFRAGHAEGVPLASFRRSVSFLRGTGVTYVT